MQNSDVSQYFSFADTGLPHYKRFSVMLARRSGAWSKTLFLWLLRSGSSIVSIPQKECSALLRGFESRKHDWEPKNRIFVYNEFALFADRHFRVLLSFLL